MNSLVARWTAIASLSLAATACDVMPVVPACQAPDAGSLDAGALDGITPVQALSVAASGDAPTFSDAGVTVTLRVSADVPCLRGGTGAAMSTSTGTIGGNAPGKPFALFLAPTGDADDTHLEGYVDLVIPYDRVARVDAVIGEATAVEHFGPHAKPADADTP